MVASQWLEASTALLAQGKRQSLKEKTISKEYAVSSKEDLRVPRTLSDEELNPVQMEETAVFMLAQQEHEKRSLSVNGGHFIHTHNDEQDKLNQRRHRLIHARWHPSSAHKYIDHARHEKYLLERFSYMNKRAHLSESLKRRHDYHPVGDAVIGLDSVIETKSALPTDQSMPPLPGTAGYMSPDMNKMRNNQSMNSLQNSNFSLSDKFGSSFLPKTSFQTGSGMMRSSSSQMVGPSSNSGSQSRLYMNGSRSSLSATPSHPASNESSGPLKTPTLESHIQASSSVANMETVTPPKESTATLLQISKSPGSQSSINDGSPFQSHLVQNNSAQSQELPVLRSSSSSQASMRPSTSGVANMTLPKAQRSGSSVRISAEASDQSLMSGMPSSHSSMLIHDLHSMHRGTSIRSVRFLGEPSATQLEQLGTSIVSLRRSSVLEPVDEQQVIHAPIVEGFAAPPTTAASQKKASKRKGAVIPRPFKSIIKRNLRGKGKIQTVPDDAATTEAEPTISVPNGQQWIHEFYERVAEIEKKSLQVEKEESVDTKEEVPVMESENVIKEEPEEESTDNIQVEIEKIETVQIEEDEVQDSNEKAVFQTLKLPLLNRPVQEEPKVEPESFPKRYSVPRSKSPIAKHHHALSPYPYMLEDRFQIQSDISSVVQGLRKATSISNKYAPRIVRPTFTYLMSERTKKTESDRHPIANNHLRQELAQHILSYRSTPQYSASSPKSRILFQSESPLSFPSPYPMAPSSLPDNASPDQEIPGYQTLIQSIQQMHLESLNKKTQDLSTPPQTIFKLTENGASTQYGLHLERHKMNKSKITNDATLQVTWPNALDKKRLTRPLTPVRHSIPLTIVTAPINYV